MRCFIRLQIPTLIFFRIFSVEDAVADTDKMFLNVRCNHFATHSRLVVVDLCTTKQDISNTLKSCRGTSAH